MSLRATASQTVGPFFSIGLAAGYVSDLPGEGPRVAVEGRMLDGDGAPVSDGCIELWDAAGGGFARVATDGEGRFRFTAAVPGRLPGPGGRPQAPHLAVSVFARGVLNRLATRMYFPDPGDCPVLALVPAARRATLVAGARADGTLGWDVVLQGTGETVFFEV